MIDIKKFYNKNKAFSLAELLITLAIIGVIAALTVPNLMTKYQKHQTAVRVKNFYSTINQVFRMSSTENGNPEEWIQLDSISSITTYDEKVEWLKQYVFPYMKYESYKKCEPDPYGYQRVCINLLEGGMMRFGLDRNGGDIAYYPNPSLYGRLEEREIENKPRYYFSFQFHKRTQVLSSVINSTNFVEPYIFEWDGTMTQLKSGSKRSCHKGCTNCNWCTKLLQLNSWEINDDYLW